MRLADLLSLISFRADRETHFAERLGREKIRPARSGGSTELPTASCLEVKSDYASLTTIKAYSRQEEAACVRYVSRCIGRCSSAAC